MITAVNELQLPNLVRICCWIKNKKGHLFKLDCKKEGVCYIQAVRYICSKLQERIYYVLRKFGWRKQNDQCFVTVCIFSLKFDWTTNIFHLNVFFPITSSLLLMSMTINYKVKSYFGTLDKLTSLWCVWQNVNIY